MARPDDARFEAAMTRLNAAEAAKREAIRELMEIGAIRSWGLVADLGEAIAARYYGVELAPPSTAGFDLTTRDGRRVQVRTLRMTPENARSSMGPMKEPYDFLMAIRLNADYSPMYAIEVPRQVLDELYPNGKRTSWTQTLERHARTTRIEAEDLMRPGLGARRWAAADSDTVLDANLRHYPPDMSVLAPSGKPYHPHELDDVGEP